MRPVGPGLQIGQLVQAIAHDRDADWALTRICETALQVTHGEAAMVATLQGEEGILELTHGAGEFFDSRARGQQVEVDIGEGFGLVAYVAATGVPVLCGDVKAHPQYKLWHVDTNSEIAVPVQDGYGRVRGVLNIESSAHDAFTESDQGLAETLASLIALVWERDQDTARIEALIQVGRALDVAQEEGDLVERVMHVTAQVLGFQACSLFLRDEATDAFVLRGSMSSLKDRIGAISYRRGEGCTGWVCENGRPVLLHEPTGDSRWRGRYLEFPSNEIASFLAVPIMSRGRCIGCIRLLRHKPQNRYLDVRYTAGDQRVLEAICAQFAAGLENVQNLERVARNERMIAWGELSAKSSHMIGNRVFALRGDINELAYQLKQDKVDPQTLDDLRSSLETNVGRVEEILQEFRDFMTATKLDLGLVDLNALLADTVKEMFPRRGEARLETEFAPDIPPVKCDPRKFRRAISELVENSLGFTPGGVVKVSTSMNEEGQGKWVCVRVEDNGPGVPADQKTIVFQPFFSGRVRGMGLGLSIVKGIVDSHGGSIQEVGIPGQGANFMILLPVQDRL